MYDYNDSSELVLIRKAQRGDVKAFSELYARIYRELYRFALYTMKHPQDAEDAVSETVIAAYENIPELDIYDSGKPVQEKNKKRTKDGRTAGKPGGCGAGSRGKLRRSEGVYEAG